MAGILAPENNINFVAIDFETANEQKSSPCSVGIAIVKNGTLAETKVWLIRPKDMRFVATNIAIHGITPDQVQHCPEFPEIWNELREYIQDQPLAAHYAPFDISVLQSTLALYGLPYPDISHHCSCEIARKVWPHLPNHKLNTVSTHLGISLNHHEAESDAIACAHILLNACTEKNVQSLTALTALFKKPSSNTLLPRLAAILMNSSVSKHLAHWSSEIHQTPDQIRRMERIAECSVDSEIISPAHPAIINGYTTTLNSCNCADFKRRRLPCKHIYRLTYELHTLSTLVDKIV